MLSSYLAIPESELGQGQPVKVLVKSNETSLAQAMAEAMLQEIRLARHEKREATLVVPAGPVDQFPLLAQMINEARISCRETVFINMDEYLTDEDLWLPEHHPLSFRGFMDRGFYRRIDPKFAPSPQNRVFPDPRNPNAIQQIIQARGGVDACFGGVGINGHIAFNEPPEPGERLSLAEFAALPSRVITLARETRTINSVTVGGDVSLIPRRAVTIGMREILACRRLRFYCNRPWQSAVVRRALHGPITPECPASFLRTHTDAMLTVTKQVAAAPEIRLR